MKMRKVEFVISIEGVDRGSWIKEQGTFHLWGSKVVYDDDYAFGKTIAIVEGIDGQVYEVIPENVKFLEPIEE